MAKRFIDSELFDDDWFMDLSKEGKILWLYFITKCDHAGLLKLNTKLCKVQTGISNIETVIKELDNRLIRVNEQLFFIPKFVVYQYPGFPSCKFPAARSAYNILEKYQLIQEGKLTITQELPNSYGNGNGNGNIGGVGENAKLTPEQKSFNFYSQQVLIAKQYTDQMSQDYVKFCNHICQKKDGDFRLPYVLKINNQITVDEFSKLYAKSGNKLDVILTKIDSLQTNVKYHGKYTDLYLTINKWLNG